MCLPYRESLGSIPRSKRKTQRKTKMIDTRVVFLGLAEAKWPLGMHEADWQEALQVPP